MVQEIITDLEGREFVVYEKHDLKCTENGSNKFWQCVFCWHKNPSGAPERVRPWVVILCWGKRGTVGQQRMNRFTTEYKARAYVGARLRDKVAKNYVSINVPTMQHSNIDSKVGLTALVETEWDLF